MMKLDDLLLIFDIGTIGITREWNIVDSAEFGFCDLSVNQILPKRQNFKALEYSGATFDLIVTLSFEWSHLATISDDFVGFWKW